MTCAAAAPSQPPRPCNPTTMPTCNEESMQSCQHAIKQPRNHANMEANNHASMPTRNQAILQPCNHATMPTYFGVNPGSVRPLRRVLTTVSQPCNHATMPTYFGVIRVPQPCNHATITLALPCAFRTIVLRATSAKEELTKPCAAPMTLFNSARSERG